MKRKMALYPGCSLEGTASGFQSSLVGVLQALDIDCDVLDDWSCCGASSAHAVNHKLYLSMNLRNLAQAQDQGYEEVLAPCAACFHRLAGSQHEFAEDGALRESLNTEAGLNYAGGVAVRNVLDLLANGIGLPRIRLRVKSPLKGMKVACYYGCLNTRLPRTECFDDREYPMSMDRVAEALGAEALQWGYKTDCCGASLFATKEEVSAGLVAKILGDAIARGADCIAVACPMCHNNLDTKQEAIRAAHGLERALPVFFITQLMGMAFGLDKSVLKLDHHFVPTDEILHCCTPVKDLRHG